MSPRLCGYCGERPAVNGCGVCGACHWAVRTEVVDGLAKLGTYLRHWDEFQTWCSEHDAVSAGRTHGAEGATPAGRAD